MNDRYRTYQPYRATNRQPKRRKLPLFIAAVVLITVARLGWSKLSHEPKPTAKAASSTPKPKPVAQAEPIPSPVWNDLQTQLNALIDSQPNVDVSIALTDITTNTTANYGITNNFAGASTTKVLSAVAFLHEVEAGQQNLKAKLGNNTAQYQIKQMVNRSNNESWDAINKSVGLANLQAYAKSIGLSSFKVSENTITASDEALLLAKLYRRQLLSEANTSLLLSYMQNTNNETMIPKVVPEGAVLYHKYGQLEDRLHDAAIIDYHGRPIVLVIYTKGGATDGSIYQSRTTYIQQLANAVLTIFYA